MTGSEGRGEAGRRGSDVRSDCWVAVELGGKPELSVSSSVEALFGASIRALVEESLQRMGAPEARVTVEDQGAVPWVIQARLEAAVRRTGFTPPGHPLNQCSRDVPHHPPDRCGGGLWAGENDSVPRRKRVPDPRTHCPR